MTDLSVCAIATYLQRLVILRLGWCKEVTDWGLLGMVETTKPYDEAVRALPIVFVVKGVLTVTLIFNSLQGDKGPSFTRTFGNMGFFKPPRLPFDDRPKLVTHNDLELFRKQAGASLLALCRLQELDLSACAKLTDSSITQVGVRQRCRLRAGMQNI